MVSIEHLLAVLVLLFFALLVQSNRESDTTHYCVRSCEWPPKPKTCVYNWMIEWFYAAGDICMSGCPNSTVPNPNNVECHQDKDCIFLNGAPRPVLVANRSLPGPSIQVCEGDTIIAHVTNNMTAQESEGTSIHWHGIHQRGTPYMDGPVMVTQCPILMDQTFTYNFTAFPAGTHWWHGHAAYQRMEGLFGSLVVRQAPEADPNSNLYDYDLPEHVVMVQNWHNYTFILPYIAALFNNFKDIDSDALLINGKGIPKGRLNPSYSEYPIFNVVQGNRYRFRVISASLGYCQLQLSADHHILKLIATDGSPIEPFDTDAFVLHTAERFDFVLNADEEVGNYWLRLVGLADSVGFQNLGIIHYEGAPEEIPTEKKDYDPSTTDTVVNECINGTESPKTSIGIAQLNYKGPDETPQKADVTFHIGIETTSPGARGPTFDHFAFLRPASVLLYQWHDVKDDFCENYPNCSERRCRCINRLKLNTNEVVEFVLMNDDIGQALLRCHPIHLHGHNFHVVAQEYLPEMITFEEFKELDRKGLIPRKLNSAVVKDTVHVPLSGYLIIRFIADNPGWWLLHCHSEGHLTLGLAMVLQEGEDEEIPPAPDGFPRCGSWSSKPMPSQSMPPLSATADLNSTGSSSSGMSSAEVELLVLLLIVSTIALALFVHVVIKHRNPGFEYVPLLRNEPGQL